MFGSKFIELYKIESLALNINYNVNEDYVTKHSLMHHIPSIVVH